MSVSNWQELFLSELRNRPVVRSAAIHAGISHYTAYGLRQQDPEFARAWDEALLEGARLSSLRSHDQRDKNRSRSFPSVPASVQTILGDNVDVIASWGVDTTGKSVYVIRETWRQLCKVGCTKDVKNRLAAIQSGLPQIIEVVAVFRSKRGVALENYIHERFNKQRYRGEWFALSPDDLAQAVDVYKQFCEVDGVEPDCWLAEK